MTDAIFALSSGKGKAGVAVVRVSGPDLRGLLKKISNQKSAIKNRYARLADLFDAGGGLIDRGIVIYFPAPNSFTGEDVVEFHVHGSHAVIEKLFAALQTLGARLAAPGEFSRRAYNNGKMDLVEAEGLAALLDSRTERQRAAAMRVASGASSDTYMRWRGEMVEIAAYAAAQLDYPADELPADIGEKLTARVRSLHGEITAALSRAGAARAVRAGFNIALVGPVNAGKSSLFNRLVGESRAIVSDVPGTTRDVVSAEVDIDGYLVRLLDTAGLRKTKDAIEKLGIERTNAEIESADLVVRVERLELRVERAKKDNEIVVYNKSDLADASQLSTLNSQLCVSALTGKGIPELLARMREEVHARLDGAEPDVVANHRTKALLEEAAAELEKSLELRVESLDKSAEHIRAAADAIGRALGIIGAQEVMDSVFGQLCLGK